MSLLTKWEPATSEDYPIVAYLCYDTTLTVFKTYKKTETVVLPLFEFAGIVLEMDDPSELVVIDGKQPYRMRLPYTEVMLERRREYRGEL